MKTKLPIEIKTVNEAMALLKSLHDNGESYHCEDDAADIINSRTDKFLFTPEEAQQLNALMLQIYKLDGFDPCGYALRLVGPPMNGQGRLETKYAFAYGPIGVPFDSFIVHPCLKIPESEEVERCKEEEAEFWGVYIHLEDGSEDWIADAETKDDACKLVGLFESLIEFKLR